MAIKTRVNKMNLINITNLDLNYEFMHFHRPLMEAEIYDSSEDWF